MAGSRKTQSAVALDAKISSVNIQTIPYDGTFDVVEGGPVRFGTSGVAALPTGGANSVELVFINFVDSSRGDVIDFQGDPFNKGTNPGIDLGDSGHLSGIRGNGIPVGLPASCWEGGVLPTLDDIGKVVYVTSGGATWSFKTGVAGEKYYGIIERVEHDRAFFHFVSVPFVSVDDIGAS